LNRKGAKDKKVCFNFLPDRVKRSGRRQGSMGLIIPPVLLHRTALQHVYKRASLFHIFFIDEAVASMLRVTLLAIMNFLCFINK
jgi:hypothetical protein